MKDAHVDNRLQQLTTSLIEYVGQLEQTFQKETNVSYGSREMFEHVRRETEPIFETLETWETLTLDSIKRGDLSSSTQMIESTVDNMRQFIMHSYYKDVRKRRYMEMKRSLLYVFHLLLKEIGDDA